VTEAAPPLPVCPPHLLLRSEIPTLIAPPPLIRLPLPPDDATTPSPPPEDTFLHHALSLSPLLARPNPSQAGLRAQETVASRHMKENQFPLGGNLHNPIPLKSPFAPTLRKICLHFLCTHGALRCSPAPLIAAHYSFGYVMHVILWLFKIVQ
jgi:hypothetical protein